MKRSSFGELGKSVETDCCDCLCLRYGLRIVISEGVKPVPPCGLNVPVDCCGKRWVSGTDARYKCNAASVTLYFSCLAGLRQDNHEQPQTLWPNVFQIVACEQPYIIIRPESCKGNTWMGRTRSDHQNEVESANGDREAGHYYWLRQSGKLRRSSPSRRDGDSHGLAGSEAPDGNELSRAANPSAPLQAGSRTSGTATIPFRQQSENRGSAEDFEQDRSH